MLNFSNLVNSAKQPFYGAYQVVSDNKKTILKVAAGISCLGIAVLAASNWATHDPIEPIDKPGKAEIHGILQNHLKAVCEFAPRAVLETLGADTKKYDAFMQICKDLTKEWGITDISCKC